MGDISGSKGSVSLIPWACCPLFSVVCCPVVAAAAAQEGGQETGPLGGGEGVHGS